MTKTLKTEEKLPHRVRLALLPAVTEQIAFALLFLERLEEKPENRQRASVQTHNETQAVVQFSAQPGTFI
jgi:hypothetical protein